MLTFGGEGLCDLVDSLPADRFVVTEADTRAGIDIYKKTVAILTQHFSPLINVEIQKYKFHECRQTQETVQEYYEHLSTLADTCGFADKDSEIKSKIISGCKSSKLRMKGLHNPNLTLTELLDHGRAYEITEKSAKAMVEREQNSVDAINREKKTGNKQNRARDQTGASGPCGYCGYPTHRGSTCPAKGEQCNSCGKRNHFASVCRNPKKKGKKDARPKKVQQIELDSQDEFFLGSVETDDSPWMTVIEIRGKKFDFKIDTGADVSVIPFDTFKSIQPRPALQATKALLRSPGGNLNCVGYFDAAVETEKGKGQMKIYVLEGKTDNLLSREAAARFGFVQRVDEARKNHFVEHNTMRRCSRKSLPISNGFEYVFFLFSVV